jgi:hypothetical protein
MLAKKILKSGNIILSFGLILAFLLSHPLAQAESGESTVPAKSRFGLGFTFAGQNVTISDFDYPGVGASWYLDWSYVGGARPGLDYLALVGGYRKYTPSEIEQQCNNIRQYVATNPDKYPHGATWVVGNEIGIDDGRTAEDYLAEFPLWKQCLKSIDPTFRVATGAIMSPYWDRSELKCESAQRITGQPFEEVKRILLETEGSGLNIFYKILSGLKQLGPEAMPDFVVQHAYTTFCATFPGWLADRDKFREVLTLYRSVMTDLELNSFELVISEYGLQNWFGYFSEDEVKQYMTDTTGIMANYTDPVLGNPADGYRLAQRWSWFVMNGWKDWQTDTKAPVDANWWPTVALFDENTRELKPAGWRYRELIQIFRENAAVSNIQ